MLRTISIGLALIVCLLAAAPAPAAVGVNLYGLSWHPSSDDFEWFNPGLGVRYEFLRRGNWKADAVAGGYRDSVGELLVHAALGGQVRLFGHTYFGGYFMAGAQGYALDEVYLVPLPALTVEAGPVDLNLHYIPRFKGASSQSAAIGFHVTVWPFGGRGEVEARPADPDARVGLEFGIASGPTLTELDARTLSLRWTVNRRHAWRFGVEGYAQHFSNEYETHGDGDDRSYTYTSDRARFELLVQHMWLFPSDRGTRFTVALGPRFAYWAEGSQAWEPGVALGLGAEIDIIAGLTVLAEYTTTWTWWTEEYAYAESHSVSHLNGGARLGVSLWW